MRRNIHIFAGSNTEGFSLVELLVVMAIVVLLSGLLVFNFKSSSTNTTGRLQVANVVVGDIRTAQSMAIAGTRYHGAFVCGYGIHRVTESSYQIYVRLAATAPPTPCKSDGRSRNYLSGDKIFETRAFTNGNVVFQSVFSDIFFQLPDPITFIDNDSSPAKLPEQINIIAVNTTGPVTSIKVYTSGKIDLIP